MKMKELEEKIINEAEFIGDDIIKVDSFLNHQIDVGFIDRMGEEFARIFSGSGASKILTVESSGIAIGCAAARAMGGLPLLFAKKTRPATMGKGVYAADIRSFTKGTSTTIAVSSEYLDALDKVIVIDDFLATGEAALGLVDIIEQAGAVCLGVGAVIEKEYQGGSTRLRSLGYRVESLAVITSLEDGIIYFR